MTHIYCRRMPGISYLKLIACINVAAQTAMWNVRMKRVFVIITLGRV